MQPRIGEGTVFDAYAFGAEVDVDLSLIDGPPLTLRARCLLPDGTFTDLRKTSPLIDLQASLRLGLFSEVTLMASFFIDTDSELSDPMRAALFKGLDERFNNLVDVLVRWFGLEEDEAADALLTWLDDNTAVDTEGLLVWTGASARLGNDRHSVSITLLGGFGQINVTTSATHERVNTIGGQPVPPELENAASNRSSTSRPVDVYSFFGEVRSRVSLTDALELGGFALVLTGDEGLKLGDQQPTLGAFAGLSPLLPRTAVFFGGTFGPDQATPTAFSLAPDASGIGAAGAHLELFRLNWMARVEAAAMTALVPSRLPGANSTASKSTPGRRFSCSSR